MLKPSEARAPVRPPQDRAASTLGVPPATWPAGTGRAKPGLGSSGTQDVPGSLWLKGRVSAAPRGSFSNAPLSDLDRLVSKESCSAARRASAGREWVSGLCHLQPQLPAELQDPKDLGQETPTGVSSAGSHPEAPSLTGRLGGKHTHTGDQGAGLSPGRASPAPPPPYLAEAALADGTQDLEVVQVHCRENRGCWVRWRKGPVPAPSPRPEQLLECPPRCREPSATGRPTAGTPNGSGSPQNGIPQTARYLQHCGEPNTAGTPNVSGSPCSPRKMVSMALAGG